MSEELLIEYGKMLLAVGIPSFIIFRTLQMARYSVRNGKREAALIFLAYACALAAATLAYFTTEGLRRSTPFQWMVGLCMVYGIVHLLVYLSAGPKGKKGNSSAQSAGFVRGQATSFDDDDPMKALPEFFDPTQNLLSTNLYHSRDSDSIH